MRLIGSTTRCFVNIEDNYSLNIEMNGERKLSEHGHTICIFRHVIIYCISMPLLNITAAVNSLYFERIKKDINKKKTIDTRTSITEVLVSIVFFYLCCSLYMLLCSTETVRKMAKIGKRYTQVPHLT